MFSVTSSTNEPGFIFPRRSPDVGGSRFRRGQKNSLCFEFFVSNGDLPVDVYRFDFLTGTRQFVRQLRPSDATGMDRLGWVLMTPDGKYYVYRGARELSSLNAASGLK